MELDFKGKNIIDVNNSPLGSKEYWDSTYDLEAQNFERNNNDVGNIWFGKGIQNRICDWIFNDCFNDTKKDISENHLAQAFPVDCKVLDVGCGNAASLIYLAKKYGLTNLTGIDYSEAAIKFCKSILSKNAGIENNITLKSVDLTDLDKLYNSFTSNSKYSSSSNSSENARLIKINGNADIDSADSNTDDDDDDNDARIGNNKAINNSDENNNNIKILPKYNNMCVSENENLKYKVILDNGTFDAISLNEDKEMRNKYICYICSVIDENGYFVVTTCNWTQDEIILIMQSQSSGEIRYKFHPQLVDIFDNYSKNLNFFKAFSHSQFTFGGKKGSKVSSVAFKFF